MHGASTHDAFTIVQHGWETHGHVINGVTGVSRHLGAVISPKYPLLLPVLRASITSHSAATTKEKQTYNAKR